MGVDPLDSPFVVPDRRPRQESHRDASWKPVRSGEDGEGGSELLAVTRPRLEQEVQQAAVGGRRSGHHGSRRRGELIAEPRRGQVRLQGPRLVVRRLGPCRELVGELDDPARDPSGQLQVAGSDPSTPEASSWADDGSATIEPTA